jgi:dihydroorotate dehydrogenase electron transfer subunit
MGEHLDSKPLYGYVVGEVSRVRRLNTAVKEYFIKVSDEIDPEPGQFAMVWMPGVGEIPLSFADYSNNNVRFIICRVGRVTTYIHEKINEGSRIFFRGPLGRGFTIYKSKKCLLVGGGYGLAPLYYLARTLSMNGCYVKTLLGFKDSRDVFYIEEFKKFSEVYVSTEDGGIGFNGVVVDLLRDVLKHEVFDIVYACGREEMLMKVARECIMRGIQVEVSLERIIKCGLGICGSCSIEPLGLRICRDGPVFNGVALLKVWSIRGEKLGEGEYV